MDLPELDVGDYVAWLLEYLTAVDSAPSTTDEDEIGCGGSSRRSIVRQLSRALPLLPARRVRFRNDLIGGKSRVRCRYKRPPYDSPSRRHGFPPPLLNLADVPWLASESPKSSIRSRCELRRRRRHAIMSHSGLRQPLNSTPVTLSLSPVTLHQSLSVIASPPPVTHTVDTPDAVSVHKLTQLEEEMTKLRQQIAQLLIRQEQNTITAAKEESPSCSSCNAPPGAPPCNPPPPPAVPSCIPPPPPPPAVPSCIAPPPAIPPPPPPPFGIPPPPPPPPPPMMTGGSTKSVLDIIKENKIKNGKSSGSSSSAGKPNMADVLKGLGSVKLKSVARSPGGTPLRRAPKPADLNDPASLIAQALKKKFSKVKRHDSPIDQDKENFTPSPPSRNTPPGQHLLKPSRRSGKLRPARLGPLMEINA